MKTDDEYEQVFVLQSYRTHVRCQAVSERVFAIYD